MGYDTLTSYFTINNSKLDSRYQIWKFIINEKGKWVRDIYTQQGLNFDLLWYKNITSTVSIKSDLPYYLESGSEYKLEYVHCEDN